jgi:hypothetical protein
MSIVTPDVEKAFWAKLIESKTDPGRRKAVRGRFVALPGFEPGTS